MSLQVYKFGGTSVASSSAIRRVHQIINLQRNTTSTLAIVVSAMGSTPSLPKTTDLLLRIVSLSVSGDMKGVQETIDILRNKHLTCIGELIQDLTLRNQLIETIENELSDILAVVRAVRILKSSDERTCGVISGYGELWSARILHAYLKQEGYHDAEMIDARQVLICNDETVDWKTSTENLNNRFTNTTDTTTTTTLPSLLVITGFICSTSNGVPSTLGRNGSDYSATIFGRLFNAESVVIWTDVSGVLSADPRKVPNAVVLPILSYDEAMELAYFGANVLHPKAMAPATMSPEIPVYIRNTFQPLDAGSCITTRELASIDNVLLENQHPIDFFDCARGFSTIDQMSLINVEGSGMIGVPGIAQRLFSSLHEKDISVTLIAQASSEHSICVAVKCSQEKMAIEAIRDGFSLELARGKVAAVTAVSPCTILAIVGDALRSTTGVAGRFFAALGASKINVLAISQGSSERNISAVVLEKESSRALRAVHAEFHLSRPIVSIVIVCDDTNMNTTRQVLLQRLERMKKENNRDVIYEVVGTAKICSTNDELIIKTVVQLKDENIKEVFFLESFASWFVSTYDNAMIIDCAKNVLVAPDQVQQWIDAGIRVCTSNARVASNMERSSSRLDTRAALCNVLPVEKILHDLQNCGSYMISGSEVEHISVVLGAIQHVDAFEAIGQMVALARACGGSEDVVISECVEDVNDVNDVNEVNDVNDVNDVDVDQYRWVGEINLIEGTSELKKGIKIEQVGSVKVTISLASTTVPIVMSGSMDTSESIALALIQGALALSPKGMQSLVRGYGSPILKGKKNGNGKNDGDDFPPISLNKV